MPTSRRARCDLLPGLSSQEPAEVGESCIAVCGRCRILPPPPHHIDSFTQTTSPENEALRAGRREEEGGSDVGGSTARPLSAAGVVSAHPSKTTYILIRRPQPYYSRVRGLSPVPPVPGQLPSCHHTFLTLSLPYHSNNQSEVCITQGNGFRSIIEMKW